MAKVTKNTTPKKGHTPDELVEILLNNYVKYEALKEVLINMGVGNEEAFKAYFKEPLAKDALTTQAKEYAKTLGVEITKSDTVETAQTVWQKLMSK